MVGRMTDPKLETDLDGRATLLDWLMIALALASVVVLVALEAFGFLLVDQPEIRLWIIYADVAICGVFFLEFAVQFLRSRDRRRMLRSRWYELIGMIPISHPLLRGFRLFRIVRVVVVTGRLKRGVRRTFGDAAVDSFLRRYRDAIVRSVEDQIMLHSLDVVEPALVNSRLPASIADALEARRGDLTATVHQSLEKIPIVRRLLKLNLSQDLLRAVEDVVIETVVTSLRSDEVNRVVQESLHRGVAEIRRAVKEKAGSVPLQALPA
jgi:voltage-gated potassium channel